MASVLSLFFAIVPPPEVRDAIHLATRTLDLAYQYDGLRVDPEKYHLTVLHLGDQVTAEHLPALEQAAAAVVAAPFSFSLELADTFRNQKPPWWFGPKDTPAPLVGLHEQLIDQLTARAVPLKPYSLFPHVTVLRNAKRDQKKLLPQIIHWPVTEFVLLRSYRRPAPSKNYDELGKWPLLGS